MKTYKLYAGMTGEFEILKTDAPEGVVVDYILASGNMNLPENDPEKFFTNHGYFVDFIACQYDDELSKEITVDQEIDIYDYI